MELLGLAFLYVFVSAAAFLLLVRPALGRIVDIRHFSMRALLLAITAAALIMGTIAAVGR
jgi:hypothetical protein